MNNFKRIVEGMLNEAFKVGDVVIYSGKKVKITKVFDGGYEVDGKTKVSASQVHIIR